MNTLHFIFVLGLTIRLIVSQGSDDPKGDEAVIYRNTSSNSSQNTSENAETDSRVVFIAYNRKNPNGIYFSLNTSESELKSILQQSLPTTFLTHGWLVSENNSYNTEIRTAYLEKTDINVIIVGWSHISRNEYILATLGVPKVGNTVGTMVSNLLTIGLVALDRVHLIGHSLGAHVMGIAGSFIQNNGHGKVARITGLDPAKPFYELVRDESSRLDIGDAEFVDVIHTSSGVFGYFEAIGHADFYPNGGYNNQPGCPIYRIFCSHTRSLAYYRESIENEKAFPSVKCDSYRSYISNKCENNEVAYMGEPTPPSTRGVFYLRTTNSETTDQNDVEGNQLK